MVNHFFNKKIYFQNQPNGHLSIIVVAQIISFSIEN